MTNALSELLGYDVNQRAPKKAGYHLLKKGEELNCMCKSNHYLLLGSNPHYQCKGRPILNGLCQKHALQYLGQLENAIAEPDYNEYGQAWIKKDIARLNDKMAYYAEKGTWRGSRRLLLKLHREAKTRRDGLERLLELYGMRIRAMKYALGLT